MVVTCVMIILIIHPTHVYCSREIVQAQPNSKGFYRTARRNLWTQVAALCGACAAVATIATVKQLLPEARRVPVIPVMLYVRNGFLCVDAAAAMVIARCVEVSAIVIAVV